MFNMGGSQTVSEFERIEKSVNFPTTFLIFQLNNYITRKVCLKLSYKMCDLCNFAFLGAVY